VSANSERSQKFTEHLQQCQGELLRYIFILVRNSEDAQDVFQQTCLTLWEKFDQFDPSQKFLAWACGVARFKACKFLTQCRRHRARFSDEFAQQLVQVRLNSEAAGHEARRAALPGCVDKLPAAQRELLKLCYGERKRVTEVAAHLGRSVCGVHNSLRLIREKLMACIERAVREEER
jgi:RNA polymerase sigma-70 factor, ECF subfamily